MNASTRWARQVYGVLLHLYPAEFRRDFGEELRLLFDDMHHAAIAQGGAAYLRFWLTILLDLVSSVSRERATTMLTAKSATALSLVLSLPFLFFLTTATLGYDPPFAAWFTEADGYTPTLLGRGVMMALLLSVPIALVINLIPRISKVNAPGAVLFVPTPLHTISGVSILVAVLAALSQQVFHELRPFVAPLGSAAVVGQMGCLLGLLLFPMAFLLNRLPSFAQSKSVGGGQRVSVNLIVGATILLLVIAVATIFMLEATACSLGVPKCD